jgi:hypothetical protein
MKVKTNELQGAALDWAVAKCEGVKVAVSEFNDLYFEDGSAPAYSTDWAQGGPIIERERISVWARGNEWAAETFIPNHQGDEQEGPTPLIAAMRCYVASKMGEEIELPNELKGE